MRKSLALVLVLTIAFSSMLMINNTSAQLANNFVENSWAMITPYPPTLGVQGAVSLNGSIYALARVPEQNLLKQYEPAKDTWVPLSPPPIINPWGDLVVCQNKIYLIGGSEATQVFDPSTNSWENKSTIPETLLGTMTNSVDGKIYIISGLHPAAYGVWDPSKETYVYDTTNDTWSTVAPIPTPVAAYASTVLDDKIYIIGGGPAIINSLVGKATTLVQIFDPKTNKWTLGEPIPTGVAGAGACSTSGYYAPKRIYVVGGDTWYTSSRYANDLAGNNFNQVFDPQTGKWSLAAPTLENLTSVSLVNINDALYAILNGRPETAEKYIPTGYKAYLLPTNAPSNSPSPSTSDPTVQAFPFQTVEIVAIFSLIAIAIVSLMLLIRHRRTAKSSCVVLVNNPTPTTQLTNCSGVVRKRLQRNA